MIEQGRAMGGRDAKENPGFVKDKLKYYFTYLWEWQLTLIILEPETQLLIKI